MRPATWTSRPGKAPIAFASTPAVATEPIEPQIEELSRVAPATSPLTGRIGLAAILVAAGVAGGMLIVGPSASNPGRQVPFTTERPARTAAGDPSLDAPTPAPTEPTVSLGDDLAVSGGAVTVEVRSPRPLGRVRVGLVVRGREVATTEADVPDAGAFPVQLTLPGVAFRADALVRLTWLAGMDEPRVLAETPLTVLPASGVELLAIEETSAGSLDIEGIAPARVEQVSVTLVDDDGQQLATAEASVQSRRTWGGAFPALGRFVASLTPGDAPEGTVRVILSWTDPWTNAEASRTAILVAEDG